MMLKYCVLALKREELSHCLKVAVGKSIGKFMNIPLATNIIIIMQCVLL